MSETPPTLEKHSCTCFHLHGVASDNDGEDLALVCDAFDVATQEKSEIRALIRAGDVWTNRWVTRLGLLAACLGVGAAIGVLFWLEIAVILLGVFGGTIGGTAIYLQSRWTTRRMLLDDEVSQRDDLLQLFAQTRGELEGGPAAHMLADPTGQPKRRRRKRRRRKAKGNGDRSK